MDRSESYSEEIFSIGNDALLVKDITLLSAECAEKLPKDILKFYDYWWLSTRCHYLNSAVFIHYFGSIDYSGCYICNDDGYARPVLIVSNLTDLNLKQYDRLKYKGIEWRVISDNMLLCNDASFGKHCFNKEVECSRFNKYELSDIRSYIYQKAKEFNLL